MIKQVQGQGSWRDLGSGSCIQPSQFWGWCLEGSPTQTFLFKISLAQLGEEMWIGPPRPKSGPIPWTIGAHLFFILCTCVRVEKNRLQSSLEHSSIKCIKCQYVWSAVVKSPEAVDCHCPSLGMRCIRCCPHGLFNQINQSCCHCCLVYGQHEENFTQKFWKAVIKGDLAFHQTQCSWFKVMGRLTFQERTFAPKRMLRSLLKCLLALFLWFPQSSFTVEMRAHFRRCLTLLSNRQIALNLSTYLQVGDLLQHQFDIRQLLAGCLWWKLTQHSLV